MFCQNVTLPPAMVGDELLKRKFMVTSASVSTIGSAFLLVCFWRIPSLRRYPLIIIMFLAVADLVSTCGMMMQNIPELLSYDNFADVNCSVVVVGTVLACAGLLASHFWTTVYAAHCVWTVWSLTRLNAVKKQFGMRVSTHVIIWPLSVVLGIWHTTLIGDPFLFLQMALGNTAAWLTLGVPVFVVWIINLICFIYVCVAVSLGRRGSVTASSAEMLEKVQSRFRVFILAYLLCWMFFFVSCTVLFLGGTVYPWLATAWVSTIPLQGACNAFILGNSQILRKQIKEKYYSLRFSGDQTSLLSSSESVGGESGIRMTSHSVN